MTENAVTPELQEAFEKLDTLTQKVVAALVQEFARAYEDAAWFIDHIENIRGMDQSVDEAIDAAGDTLVEASAAASRLVQTMILTHGAADRFAKRMASAAGLTEDAA